jgi:hypothetical protein
LTDPKDLKNDESNDEEEIALVLNNEKEKKDEEEPAFLEERVNFKERTNTFFRIIFISILVLVILFISLSCVDFINRADQINVSFIY